MSKRVYTCLNLSNFIHKPFLQIYLWDVSYVHSYCSFLTHYAVCNSNLNTDNQIYIP
jgi:hypothetical protein